MNTFNAPVSAMLKPTTMALLRTIKGTARNKERARVWLEVPQSELEQYGFSRGDRVDITLLDDAIFIVSNDSGKRKVAGRERNGNTICILDICFPDDQRQAMFNGAGQLDVSISYGLIIIKASAGGA